jgi:hypothetical protein
VLILKAVQMAFPMMENSIPFMGDPAPTEDTFAELNVDSSENIALFHLRSTVFSANDKGIVYVRQ